VPEVKSRRLVRIATGFALFAAYLMAITEVRAQDKSLLWRVRSSSNTVYILGSIHLMKKENYPLNKALEAAFQDAKKLAFEIDLRAAEPEKLQHMMVERGIYRDGRSLSQTVSEQTYAMASERAKALGLDLKRLDLLKPWAVAMMLTSMQLQKLGFDPRYGVDRHFFERAQAANKTIIGLETPEEQFRLFDQMSLPQQERMLVQALNDLSVLDTGLQRLLTAWKSGDEKLLEDLILGGFKDYPELYQRVMLDRNRQWLGQLEGFLAQTEVHMVIVGAAHLVGKGSVIELLRQRGYTVEQM
jgi:uncharacterized protein YbaP (TraB family)